MEDDDIFEIEKILDTCVRKSIRYYLVRWKGYGEEEDTWEPKENLDACEEVLNAFWKDVKEKKSKKRQKRKSDSPSSAALDNGPKQKKKRGKKTRTKEEVICCNHEKDANIQNDNDKIETRDDTSIENKDSCCDNGQVENVQNENNETGSLCFNELSVADKTPTLSSHESSNQNNMCKETSGISLDNVENDNVATSKSLHLGTKSQELGDTLLASENCHTELEINKCQYLKDDLALTEDNEKSKNVEICCSSGVCDKSEDEADLVLGERKNKSNDLEEDQSIKETTKISSDSANTDILCIPEEDDLSRTDDVPCQREEDEFSCPEHRRNTDCGKNENSVHKEINEEDSIKDSLDENDRIETYLPKGDSERVLWDKNEGQVSDVKENQNCNEQPICEEDEQLNQGGESCSLARDLEENGSVPHEPLEKVNIGMEDKNDLSKPDKPDISKIFGMLKKIKQKITLKPLIDEHEAKSEEADVKTLPSNNVSDCHNHKIDLEVKNNCAIAELRKENTSVPPVAKDQPVEDFENVKSTSLDAGNKNNSLENTGKTNCASSVPVQEGHSLSFGSKEDTLPEDSVEKSEKIVAYISSLDLENLSSEETFNESAPSLQYTENIVNDTTKQPCSEIMGKVSPDTAFETETGTLSSDYKSSVTRQSSYDSDIELPKRQPLVISVSDDSESSDREKDKKRRARTSKAFHFHSSSTKRLSSVDPRTSSSKRTSTDSTRSSSTKRSSGRSRSSSPKHKHRKEKKDKDSASVKQKKKPSEKLKVKTPSTCDVVSEIIKSSSLKASESNHKPTNRKKSGNFERRDSDMDLCDSDFEFDLDEYDPVELTNEKSVKATRDLPIPKGIPSAKSLHEVKKAIKKGDFSTILQALAGGMDVDSQDGGTGMTLLMRAVVANQDNIVRLLISHGANVNAKDNTGNSALMFACEQGYESTASLLLEAEADVNAKQISGETALIKACKNGYYTVVSLLVTHGADCEMRSQSGFTASQWAVHFGHFEIRDLLNDHNKKLQNCVETAIISCLGSTKNLISPPLLPYVCLYPTDGQKFTHHFHCGNLLLDKTILLFCFRAVFSRNGKVDLSFSSDNGVQSVSLNGLLQTPILKNNRSVFKLLPKLDKNRLVVQTYQSRVHLLVCIYATDLIQDFLRIDHNSVKV